MQDPNETEEWHFNLINPQCPVYKAVLLIHGSIFTGLGFSQEEAQQVARLKYLDTTW